MTAKRWGAILAALFGCFGYDEKKGGDRVPEIIPDGDTGGLTLGFADGYTEKKQHRGHSTIRLQNY